LSKSSLLSLDRGGKKRGIFFPFRDTRGPFFSLEPGGGVGSIYTYGRSDPHAFSSKGKVWPRKKGSLLSLLICKKRGEVCLLPLQGGETPRNLFLGKEGGRGRLQHSLLKRRQQSEPFCRGRGECTPIIGVEEYFIWEEKGLSLLPLQQKEQLHLRSF